MKHYHSTSVTMRWPVSTAVRTQCTYLLTRALMGDVRNRQLRLFTIQRLITERLGFERRPNMSAMSALSAERLRSTMERHRLDAADSDDVRLPANYLARRVITLLPACNHLHALSSLFVCFLLRNEKHECKQANHKTHKHEYNCIL